MASIFQPYKNYQVFIQIKNNQKMRSLIEFNHRIFFIHTDKKSIIINLISLKKPLQFLFKKIFIFKILFKKLKKKNH